MTIVKKTVEIFSIKFSVSIESDDTYFQHWLIGGSSFRKESASFGNVEWQRVMLNDRENLNVGFLTRRDEYTN